MNNYMSVGVDAQIALEFHQSRNEQPELFTSQFVNKFWYAHFGLKSMFFGIEQLETLIDLEVDNQPIKLPVGLGGIIILNIPTYAGGADLWGTEDSENSKKEYNPLAVDDKLVEVVAITGSFHMGTIQFNLSQAIRIGQGKRVTMRLHQQLPVQVDGEPWVESPSEIQVEFWNQAKLLYKVPDEAFSFRALASSNSEDFLHDLQKDNAKLKIENLNLKQEVERLRTDLEMERKLRKQSH